MAHHRGVHEIRGGLIASPAKGGSGQGKLMTRLARLDHQRALLESQLAVWTEKQKVTKRRLSLIDEEIDQIGRQVRGLIKPRDGARPRRQVVPGAVQQPIGSPSAQGGEISLEY
jgi:hypothetical protein